MREKEREMSGWVERVERGELCEQHLAAWWKPRTQANWSPEKFLSFFFLLLLRNGARKEGRKDGRREEGEKSRVWRVTAAHLVQQFALHSQLPRGHLLRLLALGLAGRVRVGDVDPQLSLLLSHRVEG